MPHSAIEHSESNNLRCRLRVSAARLKHLPFALLFLFSVWTGIVGVDFGHHWDEGRLTGSIGHTIETGRPLPDWYNYPSLSYDLALTATGVVAAVREALGVEPCAKTNLRECLRLTAATRDHVLNIRMVFLFVSLLGALWVYLATYLYTRSVLDALVAGGALATSWEVSYHARWIAPDALLMQFSALIAMLLIVAERIDLSRSKWLIATGCVVGLATGTKYPGGLLFLSVMLAVMFAPGESMGQRAKSCMSMALVCVAIFFLFSPGSLIQYDTFYRDVRAEIYHYAQGGHFGYTVTPGMEHFELSFLYLSTVMFSRYAPIAIGVAILSIPGVYALARQAPRLCLILASFPVVYFFYMGLQCVMIVRNLLCVVPFLALFAGIGFGWVRRRWSQSVLVQAIAVVAACVPLVLNGAWLLRAAKSIANRDRVDRLAELARFAEEHPGLTVSRGLARAYTESGRTTPAPLYEQPETSVAIDTSESNPLEWVANRRSAYALLPSGPYEVNFDYYPTWVGASRIIIVSSTIQKQMPQLLREYGNQEAR